MTHALLKLERDKLEKFEKNKLSKTRLVLIEGTHSEENLSYKNHPGNPDRGIVSLVDSFNRLNLNYQLIESTDSQLIPNLMDTDFAFPYAHGEFGEDGRLQGLLDYVNVPYIASGVLGSAICTDKLSFKRLVRQANIPTANFIDLSHEKNTTEILYYVDAIGYPVMVKLRNGGSSIGIHKIDNRNDLLTWLTKTEKRNDYFVEKFIPGRFVTVGLIKTENGLRHLPMLEVTSESEFYDADEKLGVEGSSTPQFIVNPDLPVETTAKIFNASYRAFEVCNCESIIRLDYIIDVDGNPYLLEINTIAGLAANSNLPSMFYELGYTYDEMILEIMNSAFVK
ncbi:ATP-grasp domain-containing protein [Vibrio splendidus]|uniref:D-alanine--D-alanine ligase family protein n=1 Tax=Vibrio chagasii TaxID=170679 RepID=UPI0022847972|nr:ATP-grasp domain-containing protein [Vibrio chagasii]MCY9827441.1 ATP-grasp domain-containing protein [Vibrio chagasii]